MTLTVDVLKKSLPSKYKRNVNDDLLEHINTILDHPELYDDYRNNFLTYISVIQDGKYKLDDYLNAIKYCTHKLMGESNMDSFVKTFPNRYQSMIAKGYTAKEMSAHVAMYNKNKLVNTILEQSMIPTWVLNQDLYQKAINVQADLMLNAMSEKVRSDAANSLLVHLKPPEVKKVELDVGIKQNDEIEALRNITAELAAQQRRMIEAGVITAKQNAETKLITKVYEHEA
ncbi:hypothetical protein D6D94_01970 [Moraxella catarrhalis]|uniref:hypothetical protein n=1 Tax=Moraxella catarrhalis TaxID=480 RepID=UPI000EA8A527|nr:hypothetical protein [Moraxella catarrhalis]MCG6834642.1 hypothetical protein [Moraxella catarrhalis]MPX07988.1 hypothetical protein [Moraxella catarrhalis]RKL81022.1 hypothetical protein D6D94_01970 [Moraxella catarrhalis]RKL95350.1 hypothetical protein D6E02_01635 [Moraxella catarrhalis]RKL99533.1 hypothetical protein D6D96_03270 [Moraxella catarrhalis]